MAGDNPQKELLQQMASLLQRLSSGGDLGPVNRDDWDGFLASQPPEERELVSELARFADLWRYFQERGEKLGPEIVESISEVHKLAVPERTARLKEINQKLMERVQDAGAGAQFRQ